jgi:hypothetical protein
LIKTRENINKKILIQVIEQFVLNNSELFMHLGFIMHLIIMRCVEESHTLPNNVCGHDFIVAQAANWHGWQKPLHQLVNWAIEQYFPLLLSHNIPLGKSWFLGYSVTMFHGNTITLWIFCGPIGSFTTNW